MRAVAEKPHGAVVKFDTHRNVQRHCAVLPAIARLLFSYILNFVSFFSKFFQFHPLLSFFLQTGFHSVPTVSQFTFVILFLLLFVLICIL